jgi:hypothetical protein
VIKIYICLDCNNLFEEPKSYNEPHILDSPPYPKHLGCPKCGGMYALTEKCDICNKYAEIEYITTKDGQTICNKCFKKHEIGEEYQK